MPYCVCSDVRKIIDTDLEDESVTELIVQADSEISGRGLSSIKSVKLVSMLLTASIIALRDPKSRSIGEFVETLRGPEDYRKLAEDIIAREQAIPFIAKSEEIE